MFTVYNTSDWLKLTEEGGVYNYITVFKYNAEFPHKIASGLRIHTIYFDYCKPLSVKFLSRVLCKRVVLSYGETTIHTIIKHFLMDYSTYSTKKRYEMEIQIKVPALADTTAEMLVKYLSPTNGLDIETDHISLSADKMLSDHFIEYRSIKQTFSFEMIVVMICIIMSYKDNISYEDVD
jgi:hypothetical protein